MTIKRAVAAVVAVMALVGCGRAGGGGTGGTAETGATGPAASDPDFSLLAGAVEAAKVAVCEPEEGGAYIALPAPQAAARDLSYFRYLEGRIYEFGPCQLAPGARNELRAYRYTDTAGRDQALTDVARRNTRPTSTFAFRDTYAVEIWSPEPSLDTPAGQAAAQVHSAVAQVPQARHHDVPATAAAVEVAIPAFLFCPADLAVAAGTEVRWANSDAAPHRVTAVTGGEAFDSGLLTTGQAFAFRFDRPGTYEYFCSLHPSMRGSVTVT